MVGLLGDDSGAPKNTPTVQSADAGLKEAWKLWCEATKRPRQYTPHKSFARQYRSSRSDRISHNDLLYRIKVAAYLPPRPRDPADTRRAEMSMRGKDVFRQGEALFKEGADVRCYGEGDVEGGLTVARVAEELGVPSEAWALSEHTYCDQLRKLSEADLEYAVNVTQNELGVEDVFPSQVVQFKRLWSDPNKPIRAKRNDSRHVNERGRAEATEVDFEALAIDKAAQSMYVKGASAADVMKFHNRAPEGFWDEVRSRIKAGFSTQNALAAAERQFNWDSRSRI